MNIIANQSLFDIAIQENGSVFTVIDWALKNGISTTATIVPGARLKKPASTFTDVERATYFKNRQQSIATLFKPDVPDVPAYLDYVFPHTFPLL